MGRLILATGGSRSGKSRFACDLASGIGGTIVFLATCVPEDDEMRTRVEEHKKRRPVEWLTIEEPYDPLRILNDLSGNADVVILDCLTLLISNLLAKDLKDSQITARISSIAAEGKSSPFVLIVVSNEVGCGVVPANRLARHFRDIAGISNQIMAKNADEVYHLVCGIPTRIKGGGRP